MRDEPNVLLLHYSGHGVPAPSALGELWFFNEGYTEYVPTRAVEVAAWLGAPRLMIFDCPCAGRAVDSLASHPRILQQKAVAQHGSHDRHGAGDGFLRAAVEAEHAAFLHSS